MVLLIHVLWKNNWELWGKYVCQKILSQWWLQIDVFIIIQLNIDGANACVYLKELSINWSRNRIKYCQVSDVLRNHLKKCVYCK